MYLPLLNYGTSGDAGGTDTKEAQQMEPPTGRPLATSAVAALPLAATSKGEDGSTSSGNVTAKAAPKHGISSGDGGDNAIGSGGDAASGASPAAHPAAAAAASKPKGILKTPTSAKAAGAPARKGAGSTNGAARRGRREPTPGDLRAKLAYRTMERLLDNTLADAQEVAVATAQLTGEEMEQIAEERALAGLCGNPSCSASPSNGDASGVPGGRTFGGRYKIDLATKRVYEKQAPGGYCSSACRAEVARLARALGNLPDAIARFALRQQQRERQQQAQQQARHKALQQLAQPTPAATTAAPEAEVAATAALGELARAAGEAHGVGSVAGGVASGGGSASVSATEAAAAEAVSDAARAIGNPVSHGRQGGTRPGPSASAAVAQSKPFLLGDVVERSPATHAAAAPAAQSSSSASSASSFYATPAASAPAAPSSSSSSSFSSSSAADAVEGYEPRPRAQQQPKFRPNARSANRQAAGRPATTASQQTSPQTSQPAGGDGVDGGVGSSEGGVRGGEEGVCVRGGEEGVRGGEEGVCVRGGEEGGVRGGEEGGREDGGRGGRKVERRRVSFSADLEQVRVIPSIEDQRRQQQQQWRGFFPGDSAEATESGQQQQGQQPVTGAAPDLGQGQQGQQAVASAAPEPGQLQQGQQAAAGTVPKPSQLQQGQQAVAGASPEPGQQQQGQQAVAGASPEPGQQQQGQQAVANAAIEPGQGQRQGQQPVLVFELEDPAGPLDGAEGGAEALEARFGRLTVLGASGEAASGPGRNGAFCEEEGDSDVSSLMSDDECDDQELIPGGDDDSNAEEEEDDNDDRDSGMGGQVPQVQPSPWYEDPGPAARMELSSFGRLFTHLDSWITQDTLNWLRDPQAPTPSATAGGGADALHHQRGVAARFLHMALPSVMRGIKCAVPRSEVEAAVGQLLGTFQFQGALPALQVSQWQLLALVLVKALSFVRLPSLQPWVEGREGVAAMTKLAEGGGHSIEELDSLLELLAEGM